MATALPDQKTAPLDDIMLAMDVVDTLRHGDALVERELAADQREEDLLKRLRDIYAKQGIAVPDEILKQGVQALREERFAYNPPTTGLAVRLAHLYVQRGQWGRRIALGAAVLVVLAGGYVFGYQIPQARQAEAVRIELTDTLPKMLDLVSGDILREAIVEPPKQRAMALLADGMTAARDGKVEAARTALADLQAMRSELRLDYDIRIVSRPGEQTGVWRQPGVNRNARNYYLIVEAIGRNGRAIPRTVTSEEDGKSAEVTKWGQRVPQSLFDEIRRDKADDGIVQNALLGRKARGTLEPQWRVPLPNGAITSWQQ